jgi:hypothetical protein
MNPEGLHVSHLWRYDKSESLTKDLENLLLRHILSCELWRREKYAVERVDVDVVSAQCSRSCRRESSVKSCRPTIDDLTFKFRD